MVGWENSKLKKPKNKLEPIKESPVDCCMPFQAWKFMLFLNLIKLGKSTTKAESY